MPPKPPPTGTPRGPAAGRMAGARAAAATAGASMGPGLLAAGVVVALAFALHAAAPAVPALSLCVLFGAVAANVPLPPRAERWRGRLGAGMKFSARHLMRAGIVVLGLQLVMGDVLALGWWGIAAIAGVVAVAFAGTWLLARAFRLPGDQPVLLAAGFSICGASAIGAMAEARGSQRDAPVPVALVTLCGTLAIAVLPALNTLLGLGALAFGHWVGASVHDVGQVVATAQTAGTTALAAAVVVKLVRVLALAPVSLLGALAARRGAHPVSGGAPLVPLFVIGFALMVALRSSGVVPPGLLDAAHLLQEVLLGTALAGLGFAIRLRELFATAWRSTVVALSAWLVVAVAGLGVVAVMAAT